MAEQHVIGAQAERAAYEFLKKQGLKLVQQNYRCSYGEIDLIMQEGDELVFIEVRCRQRVDYGNAIESINRTKLLKIIKTATHYLQQRNSLHHIPTRFDVIAIHPVKGHLQLEWLKNAFNSDC